MWYVISFRWSCIGVGIGVMIDFFLSFEENDGLWIDYLNYYWLLIGSFGLDYGFYLFRDLDFGLYY